jgi:lysophospholipase L1-like esterase
MKKAIALLAVFITVAGAPFATRGATDDPQSAIDTQVHAPPIVVACVGDSITANGNPHGYPAQLGNMLGEAWKVENFGVSGTTLMTQVPNSYQKTPMFQNALASKADVVVIMLGTNDSKAANWPKKDFFVGDYEDLIEKFKAMESKPRIFVMKSPYVCATNRLKMSDAAVVEEGAMIDQIAKDENVGVLDAHAPTAGHEYASRPAPLVKRMVDAVAWKSYDTYHCAG